MKVLNILFIAAIILFGVTFSLLNGQNVDIKYYIGSASMPLPMLLALTLVIGMLMGLVLNLFSLIRLKIENKKLLKKVSQNEQEISKLRMLNIETKD